MNGIVHKYLVSLKAIHDANLELMTHPPYSPELAPSDFHLISSLKDRLQRTKFESDEFSKKCVSVPVSVWYK